MEGSQSSETKTDTETEANDLVKSLVKELLIQLGERERPELEAIGQRLAEIQRCMGAMAISLERLSYIAPIQETAHLAMQALLRSTRGPQDAQDIADMAMQVAMKMHSNARRALAKFAEIALSDQHSEDETDEGDTIPPPPADGDDGSALRATG